MKYLIFLVANCLIFNTLCMAEIDYAAQAKRELLEFVKSKRIATKELTTNIYYKNLLIPANIDRRNRLKGKVTKAKSIVDSESIQDKCVGGTYSSQTEFIGDKKFPSPLKHHTSTSYNNCSGITGNDEVITSGTTYPSISSYFLSLKIQNKGQINFSCVDHEGILTYNVNFGYWSKMIGRKAVLPRTSLDSGTVTLSCSNFQVTCHWPVHSGYLTDEQLLQSCEFYS